jgi:hypothetical protein
MQSVPITTNVVNSIPAHARCIHPKGFDRSFVIHISINEGVLINVLVKQTEGVKIYFVIYLEKIKKQSRTERLKIFIY